MATLMGNEMNAGMGAGATGGPLPNSTGVGIGGSATVGDQFSALIVSWNAARILSKPPAVRHMLMLRQRGQGGTFDTEPQAYEARRAAARNLDSASYDELIDVYDAGFNAYETLMIRAHGPNGGPVPDLLNPPIPYPDLNESEAPQPFDQWMTVGAPADGGNGVGSQWAPLPTDTSEIGSTWSGIAKRTTAKGTYTKMRFLPYGYIQDRWVRTA